MFRDQGACATLLAVHVFYVTCPAVVTSLAVFVETPAGREITSIVQRHGVCVVNAVALKSGRPSYLCKSDGSWYYLTGGCECLPGHEPLNDTSRCTRKLLLRLYNVVNARHHYCVALTLQGGPKVRSLVYNASCTNLRDLLLLDNHRTSQS